MNSGGCMGSRSVRARWSAGRARVQDDTGMRWWTAARKAGTSCGNVREQEAGSCGSALSRCLTPAPRRRCHSALLPLPAHHPRRCSRFLLQRLPPLLFPCRRRPAGEQSTGRQARGSRCTARKAGTPACGGGAGQQDGCVPRRPPCSPPPHNARFKSSMASFDACPAPAPRQRARLRQVLSAWGPGPPALAAPAAALACGKACWPPPAAPGYPAP